MKDYKLSEVQAICSKQADCESCPFHSVFGYCKIVDEEVPAFWNIEEQDYAEESN